MNSLGALLLLFFSIADGRNKYSSTQLWHQRAQRAQGAYGGGRFGVLWCISGSFYIATFGPQHDWRVIFRLSAWGIMLSAQPITDLHTHSTAWPDSGWGGGGFKHATTDHVRWDGVACAPTSTAAIANPKVEAGASIFGWRGRRWTRSLHAPTFHLSVWGPLSHVNTCDCGIERMAGIFMIFWAEHIWTTGIIFG